MQHLQFVVEGGMAFLDAALLLTTLSCGQIFTAITLHLE